MYGDPRGSQGVVYMRFGKCMGTVGVIGGRLYEVWEVYGDPRGVIGVVYMWFGQCMGTLGVISMRFGKCMGTL